MNTITTRPRRQDEDNIEYTFMSDDEYDQAKSAASLWDESLIYGNRYGLDAGVYRERMNQGENFIVCSIPSNDIVKEMGMVYRREYMKTIHLLTDLELSRERMRRRDLVVSLGRVAIDAAMNMADFQADYFLRPSRSLGSDKENFVRLVRDIIV